MMNVSGLTSLLTFRAFSCSICNVLKIKVSVLNSFQVQSWKESEAKSQNKSTNNGKLLSSNNWHHTLSRHTTTETRVAYDNSAQHAINTRHINSTKETSLRINPTKERFVGIKFNSDLIPFFKNTIFSFMPPNLNLKGGQSINNWNLYENVLWSTGVLR